MAQLLPGGALASEGRRVVFESLWQDAVARGLLAAAVSMAAQWAAPEALATWRRLRARRAARRERRALASKASPPHEVGDGGQVCGQ